MDAKTVACLEGRCPGLSRADHVAVNEVFNNGLAFSQVTDIAQRQSLCTYALGYKGIIPSFKTFHANVNYLAPMVHIVKKAFFTKSRCTIRQALERRYNPGGRFPIQISEHEFSHIENRPSEYGFWSAYRQLFLYTMRNFYGMSDFHKPRGACGQIPASTDGLKTQFQELAQRLGFRHSESRTTPKYTPEYLQVHHLLTQLRPPSLFDYDDTMLAAESSRISNILQSIPKRAMETPRPPWVTGVSQDWHIEKKRRYGMPDIDSYRSDQKYLFLTNIYADYEDVPGEDISSFFVKRDMFISFFGGDFVNATMEGGTLVAAPRISPDLGPTRSPDIEMASVRTPEATPGNPSPGSNDPVPATTIPVPSGVPEPPNTQPGGVSLSSGSGIPISLPMSAMVPLHTPASPTPAMSGFIGPILFQNHGRCQCPVRVSPAEFFAAYDGQAKPDPPYLIIYHIGKNEITCLRPEHLNELKVDQLWIAKPLIYKSKPVLTVITLHALVELSVAANVVFAGEVGHFKTNLLLPYTAPDGPLDMPWFNETTQQWSIVPGELL